MLLKRLELVGFKSFAQKTTFEFAGGITAIVGPNGSGKSNVIDGIRWLLGEREAKNIRGAKAEDLIFAGTAGHPRMGMAQVSIVFDNSSKFFPIDYEEVVIRRKVTRDGVSTYYLNDAEIRMKDIIDFFAKARLGTKGLTVINQGSSDIFVKASPKERRVMVEEILGLRQYQLKKHEAELKLQNAKVNLDKINAMINELQPRLRLLRRQTAKWEKQADLEKELRELEQQYFGRKLYEIERALQDIDPKIKELDSQISEKEKELEILQKELKKVEALSPPSRGKINDIKKRQSELLQKKFSLQTALGRLDAQLEFLASKQTSVDNAKAVVVLKEVRDSLQNILNDGNLESMRGSIARLIERINHVLEEGGAKPDFSDDDIKVQKNNIHKELNKIEKELGELYKQELETADSLQSFNNAFKKAFGAVEAKKDELQKLNDYKNRILFEKEKVKIQRQELEKFASQSGRKLAEFSAQEGEVDSSVEKRMLKIRGELASIGDVDDSLIKEAQEVEERFAFLSGQKEDLEKAIKDLNALIKGLDSKIHKDFSRSLKKINEHFSNFVHQMFGGGKASMKLQQPASTPSVGPEEVSVEAAKDVDEEHTIDHGGIEVSINVARKKISGLDMLSGGERSLVSIAALFALISVSPPPFLVLDEVDAPLDERNARRFAELVKAFSKKSQFILVTHNRATMEAADVLYGVTMKDDGTSHVLSVKLE